MITTLIDSSASKHGSGDEKMSYIVNDSCCIMQSFFVNMLFDDKQVLTELRTANMSIWVNYT